MRPKLSNPSPLNDDVGTPLNDDDMNGMQTQGIYCHRQVPGRVEIPVAAARTKSVILRNGFPNGLPNGFPNSLLNGVLNNLDFCIL